MGLTPRILSIGLLLASLPACVAIHDWNKRQTQKHREIELADVAKSWCQTIRASQVIPVYPLTEDLQPGDVFLVTRTIEDQAEEYKTKGFLPLDYHLMRLDPQGYGAFYSHSVLANDVESTGADDAEVGDGRQDPPRIPAVWMRPDGGLAAEDPVLKSWTTAPRAAFPSYSFSTESGAGFNLAVPVQGVPVGLGLLGSQAASGTITIGDARTVGIDMVSMWGQLRTAMRESSSRFSAYATTPGKPVYLRVVTRIYLAGSMDVSISSSSSAGGGLDVGAPRPIDLLTKGPPEQGEAQAATAEQYADNLKAINDMLAADTSRPGGSVRVTVAGGNTVGLKDTFDPPLVVGYLGFDCEVLPGGVPGPPVPTLITLTDSETAEALFAASPDAHAYQQAMLGNGVEFLRAALRTDALPSDVADSGQSIVDALDALGARVDDAMPVYMRELAQADGDEVLLAQPFGERADAAAGAPYDRFRAYRSALESSLHSIDDVASLGEFRVRTGSSAAPSEPIELGTGDAGALVAADRARIEEALAGVTDVPEEQSALRDLQAWLTRFWTDPKAK